MRSTGYYWVKRKEKWEIGYYENEYDRWSLFTSPLIYFKDIQLEDINENILIYK